jgi:hypothetical protein
MKKNKRTISPRLADGASRVNIYHRLPDEIKEGLRAIAHEEKESVGWVLEQVIIRYFKFDKPEYKKVKKNGRT